MEHRETPVPIIPDPASFKDPDARVLLHNDRVYRRFTPIGAGRFRAFADSGLANDLVSRGKLIEWREVPEEEFPAIYSDEPEGTLVVEHPPIPFISYCYEWSYEMLRAAALLHLELLRVGLEHGYTMKDATPYNVQFIGPRPLFIDIATFVPWQQGTPWQAYTQFCRMFLNPLLLTGLTGVHFQPWLRSSLEGIDPADLTRLLPFRKKLRRGVAIDVVFQAWLSRKFGKANPASEGLIKNASVGRKQVLDLANRLERTIQRLKPPRARSHWIDYDKENQYEVEGEEFKERLVDLAVSDAAPNVVWDLGCNTGRYSLIAARHAQYVIAMDRDADVIDVLYRRISDRHFNVLPLVVDVLNPSPDQGWKQAERRSVVQRGRADFVLCLALIHHVAIGGNVPLADFATWLASITRGGIIEFVPKSDPMVRDMLRWREEAYPWYNQTNFEENLGKHFRVVDRSEIPGTQRFLYVFSS